MDKKIFVKNLIVLFKIIVAVFLFISLNLLFMPKYIEKNTDGRLTAEYYRENTPVDVIVTGSSLVHAGVSPMVLYRENGITAYNRSNSSQTIAISYYMIEDAIKRNKPSLVVADVGFIYESADYVDEGSSRKSFDSMRWSSSKVNAIKASMDESESFIDYVFPILRFHTRWNDLSLEDLKYMYYKPTVTHNGQILKFNNPDQMYEINPYMLDEGAYACDENIEYLQKICDICKANNVQLLFIKMPSVQGKWNSAIDDQVKILANKNSIIYKSYLEELETLSLDSFSDFEDDQHMNVNGAEKFTKALGEFIIDNYNITDRRNDLSTKAIFDKKLDKYEIEINNN